MWHRFDATSQQTRTINVTSSATMEVHAYLSEPNILRKADPLTYWEKQKAVYPNLYALAVTFLCTPASSVPCERLFSKAGELLCKKRNRLSPKTLEKLIFLNKNEYY